MESHHIGMLGFVVLLGLIGLRVPIAFALTLVGLGGLVILSGPDATFALLASQMYVGDFCETSVVLVVYVVYVVCVVCGVCGVCSVCGVWCMWCVVYVVVIIIVVVVLATTTTTTTTTTISQHAWFSFHL
jgi:hypothetical protein